MKDAPIAGCAEANPEQRPKCNPFGTRYLTDESRVFEHNAWDNVEWSEDQQEDAEKVVEQQKCAMVDKDKAARLLQNPADQWDAFYANNENRFFKDRNWLLKEFPELDVTESNKKALLRLTCEALRFRPIFDEILKDKDLRSVKNDPLIGGSKELLYVLLYEFLVGSGLNRCSPKLKAVIFRRTKQIHDLEKLLEGEGRGVQSIKNSKLDSEKVIIPRYARINTLKWSREEAMKSLEEEKWKVFELAEGENYADRVSQLKDDEVMVDPHVDDLLIFSHTVAGNFHEYWMVDERYIILQDKASCLPAFLLRPKPGSHVFDTCAAPGMKTGHVAALMNNAGKVWAMDRATDRIEIMKSLLEASGVTCASVFCGDFLKTDVTDKKFAKVKFAIVDPPCSGSGIVKRMDEIVGGDVDKQRLEKLKNLQAMILKHALKFPGLRRAVYSTCSVHEEENEQVVDEVLLDTYVRQHFRLKENVLPSWQNRGLDTYEIGRHCLRADPNITLTNGFFVAVFERIPS